VRSWRAAPAAYGPARRLVIIALIGTKEALCVGEYEYVDPLWLRVHGASCPYCQVPMLRLGERSGKVTCLRVGSCFDANGDHPDGFTAWSVSGEAFIAWNDGYCQYADLTTDAP
jgi:hypothetical protein